VVDQRGNFVSGERFDNGAGGIAIRCFAKRLRNRIGAARFDGLAVPLVFVGAAGPALPAAGVRTGVRTGVAADIFCFCRRGLVVFMSKI